MGGGKRNIFHIPRAKKNTVQNSPTQALARHGLERVVGPASDVGVDGVELEDCDDHHGGSTLVTWPVNCKKKYMEHVPPNDVGICYINIRNIDLEQKEYRSSSKTSRVNAHFTFISLSTAPTSNASLTQFT